MPRFRDFNLHICRRVGRYHRLILAVALVATLLGGWLTTRLSLESDLAELLPESFASVQALERMKQEVGGISVLNVVLRSDSFPALEPIAGTLEPKLTASEHVRDVEYSNPVEFYEKHALLYLEAAELDSLEQAVQRTIDREKGKLNPFVVDDLFADEEESAGGGTGELTLEDWEKRYREELPPGYYTNPDSTVMVLQVYPSEGAADLAFNRKMLADVQRRVRSADLEGIDPDVSVHYGGNVKNRIDEFEAVKSDIFGTAGYGIAGVFLLILLYFGTLAAPVLISLSLLSSLSWTFGLTYLVIGQLNTITGFLFVILFGLGIDYGIHAFVRYRESRRAGLGREASLHKMTCETGAALGTTTLTTAAAFYSLMLMDFRGFSELGLIAGTGLIFAFVAMVVVLPSLVIAAENLGLLEIEPVEGKELDFERRPLTWARTALVAGAAVTVAAGWGFLNVGFQYDFTNLRVVTEQREKVGELTQDVFRESMSPAAVLTGSRRQAKEVTEAVRERMEGDSTPTVQKVQSVHSLVPDNQERRLEIIRRIRRLVQDEATGEFEGEARRRVERLQRHLRADAPIDLNDLPEQDTREFRNKQGEISNFVLIFPDVPLRDGRNAIAFRNDVGTIRTDSGRTFHAASPNIIVADLITMVIREGKIAVVLSLGVVFLLLLFDVRSPRDAALIMVPLVVGVVWMGGAMKLTGMQINLFNIVVLPAVIGVGVDSGVHIYHRYLEEGPGSLPLVLRRTGLAVTMATVTTMVGFSGLVVATHPGLQSIGKLALIGLATTLLSALTMLPALLETVGTSETTSAQASAVAGAAPLTETPPRGSAEGAPAGNEEEGVSGERESEPVPSAASESER